MLHLDPSLRAQRSNPVCRRGAILDCFAALAMTMWRECASHFALAPPTGAATPLAAHVGDAAGEAESADSPGGASLARRNEASGACWKNLKLWIGPPSGVSQ